MHPKTGKHAWPFQFRVPKSYKPIEARTFHLEYHRDRTEFDLPPTFIDRGMPYILQFAVVAEVKRGFMKLDNVVRAPFRHVPISIPDFPASNLRQDAYRHGLLLPSPEVDVEGYSTTETRLSGTWNNSPFELRCQLFLPLPHQYTTGSPIHFFLKFTPAPPSASSTSMAKSKSTSPSSGRVSPLALVRSRSRAYSHPPGSPQAEGSKRGGGGDGGSGSQQSMLDPELFDFLTRPSSLHVALARVMTVDGRVKPVANGMEALGVATLWEATGGIPGAGAGPTTRGPGTGLERVLQGEIPLRSSLLPDFVFPCLEVGYEIKLKFSSSLQPASSPLQAFPQLPNIVVFASPSAPNTSFPATSPLATASPAYRFTPPLVEFNANLQQRIPVLDTTKVRPALPALPMAAGAPGGSIYSSGSSAAGGSGGLGQAQRGQPALQLMMPPFLSVPVALVNASRLNEPKPRSMGSSSTVRTTDTTTPLLARSTSAARER
ncbi:hypothetical protein DL93DRAFT_1875881 [Clavulina sp. PMI_390]|nr:hypothetical protein DL93DRAFT_1875881 [Clavulina sp. PMI_390]